jgi:Fe-S-cluster containining protein
MSENNEISFIVPEDMKYDCLRCGGCCRFWSIAVEKGICENLSSTHLWKSIKDKYPSKSIVFLNPEEDQGQMEKIDGSCIMLDDNLCRIHKELDPIMKPGVCRIYPFIFNGTPDGIYISASYHCPAVRKNEGLPFADHIPELIKTLVEIGEEFTYEDEIRIAPNLSTNWEGYLVIEKFISDSLKRVDLMDGLWESVKALTGLIKYWEEKNETSIGAEEIKQLLENPPHTPLEVGGQIAVYQVQFVTSMISVLELWKRSFDGENASIILHGGAYTSDTFEKKITVRPFSDHIKENATLWNSEEFSGYMKHIIEWRKYLLSKDSLLSSLIGLTFFPLLFIWYSSVQSEMRGSAEVEKTDLTETLGILDLYLFHLGLFKSIIEKFAEGIMWFSGLNPSSPPR